MAPSNSGLDVATDEKRGASGSTAWSLFARTIRPAVDLEVVIPVLNEEARLPRTLDRTLEYLAAQSYSSAVVVVDNGSVDGTSEVVRAAMGGSVPVHLIGCQRAGKGSAVRRGFATGRSRYVGFMDADLATPIEALDQVVPLLVSGASAVIASRYHASAYQAVRQPALRRIGSTAFRLAARSVVPGLSDTQCGFKFFSGPVARRVSADCQLSGFSFDVEFLGRVLAAGHKVVEFPVVWTDVEGSTFHPLQHGLASFRDTAQLRRLLAAKKLQAVPASC
ncbi:glycosyltransferase [Blastococcus sp. SYSU DS0973]